MKIFIKILGLVEMTTIELDDENNYCKLDYKIVELDSVSGTMREILKVVSLWDYNYINNDIIDATEYSVKVVKENKITVFRIQGKYPDNFANFLSIISKIKSM